MSPMVLAQLVTDALYLALRLAAPVVLAVAVVGFVIGVIQSAAQASDASAGFVSKLAAAAGTLFLMRAFMGHELVQFSSALLHQVAQVAR